ncbi:hypothetical protein EVAR_41799_1 [Eumeta japonica]|uniref:Uncharacterized protein n=1 Tax=Eumeta variegata TaxID=151549 RepID=A0A4C1W064_EUMVA|nr:hypothetical protein EVAR_41799_1 [Eumeta japonica]
MLMLKTTGILRNTCQPSRRLAESAPLKPPVAAAADVHLAQYISSELFEPERSPGAAGAGSPAPRAPGRDGSANTLTGRLFALPGPRAPCSR